MKSFSDKSVAQIDYFRARGKPFPRDERIVNTPDAGGGLRESPAQLLQQFRCNGRLGLPEGSFCYALVKAGPGH